MAKHPTSIPGFDTVEDAAEYICDLRYDKLHAFFTAMENKLMRDSDADLVRGREQLSRHLHLARCHLGQTRLSIGHAWTISEPHMREKE